MKYFTLIALLIAMPALAGNTHHVRTPASDAEFVVPSADEEVTFVTEAPALTEDAMETKVTCEEVPHGPAFCRGAAKKCSDGGWKCKPNCFKNHGHTMCVH
ncbi:MAG: hypothetical protein ACXVB9_08750 [Bdellovibrionota bacterium]